MPVDKDQLLKPRLPERDVDLPGVGTVRVRALSRAEALTIRKIAGSGQDVLERKMLALAMVDPSMTEGEAREWQEASTAGEIEPVTDAIADLSGMKEGAAKEAYQAFEADADTEFRVPVGRETRDDRGTPDSGDE
ncbi:MAG: hypothetical protein ACRD0W_16685 [Acidimicrobiales bacterium]